MRYIEIPVYKFEELKVDIKEKVINQFRENNDMPFLKESLMERLNEILKENNIEVLSGLELYYSLTCSQGDGVCFIGNFEYKGLYFYIRHVGRYYHYNSININHELNYEILDEGKITDEEIDKLVREFRDAYKAICNKLEKVGYENIEWENKEETIRDTIEANEYEFFANGDISPFSSIESPDKQSFNRIFDKAVRWLDNKEFHSWLCRCYGAMSVPNGRRILVKSIEGQIYSLISNRKRK